MPGLFAVIRRKLHRLAYSGLPPHAGIEVRRRVFLVNVFCLVGLSYLLVTGISALLNARTGLAVFILACAALAFGNFLYLRYSSDYRRSGHAVAGIITAVFIYLLCMGGVANTGPLWCYSAVPLILFLYGSRRGLLWIGSLILFSLLVLFIPDMPLLHADYSFEFKSRFIASFIAVVIMSLLYEYAREESYQRMLKVQMEAKLEARTDPLTGLANRRHMFERIESVLEDAMDRDCEFSILLCDIDHFKAINDNYGHHYGDDVLVAVTRVFECTLRGEDLISRWGGEEFLILLPCTKGETAYKLAEKLRTRVGELQLANASNPVRVTLSIGVQEFDPAQSIDQNIMRADHNLYLAKQRGRNCVVAST